MQELNRILFSALENSLVGTSGTTFIHRLYHGTIVNSIVCKECGNVSQRQVSVAVYFKLHPVQTYIYNLKLYVGVLQEDFLDLTVCVCGVSSLEEALWNMFVEEELFEGNNLYRCAQCDRLVNAAKVSGSFQNDLLLQQKLEPLFLIFFTFLSSSFSLPNYRSCLRS